MNRKITFRGKDIDDGKWYEGYYLKLSETTYCCEEDYKQSPKNTKHYIVFDRMTDWGLPNKHLKVEVDPTTVGQYTGLQDKNGIQIFEGDIIWAHYANAKKAEFIEQVVFKNGRFCATDDNEHFWAPLCDGVKHFVQDETVYMDWCEVIGNIHDNPELISKEEREEDD